MKNKFFKNTLILILGGFITKIMSMLIKIIMTRNISENAIGLYMMVVPSYNLFITLVTAGMQISISKLISENKESKKEILSTSIRISLVISTIVIIVVLISSKYIAALLHNKLLYYPIISTILSLPFISISSILKGYFFGKNKMHVQVISNFIEQIIRILLFILVLPNIHNDIKAITFIIGSNIINELISIFVLSLFMPKIKINKKDVFIYNKNIKKEIFKTSIPATTSRLIGTISYFFEPILITNLLLVNGYSKEFITREYGIITGYSMQLMLLPSFFSMAISQSLIPVISNAFFNKRYKYIKKKIREIIFLSFLIGFFYTVIILINPNLFLKLIYNTNLGANYVKIMAPIFILLYIQSPLTAILQSINLANKSMLSTIYGVIIKTVLMIILSFLKCGIYAFIIPMLLNIIFVTTYNYIQIKKHIILS